MVRYHTTWYFAYLWNFLIKNDMHRGTYSEDNFRRFYFNWFLQKIHLETKKLAKWVVVQVPNSTISAATCWSIQELIVRRKTVASHETGRGILPGLGKRYRWHLTWARNGQLIQEAGMQQIRGLRRGSHCLTEIVRSIAAIWIWDEEGREFWVLLFVTGTRFSANIERRIYE